MAFWKRQKTGDSKPLDLEEIILQDLGNDCDKWLDFFKKKPELAVELFFDNKKWILVFQHHQAEALALCKANRAVAGKVSLFYTDAPVKELLSFLSSISPQKPDITELLKKKLEKEPDFFPNETQLATIRNYFPKDEDLEQFTWFYEIKARENYPVREKTTWVFFAVLWILAAAGFTWLSWPLPSWSWPLQKYSIWNGILEFGALLVLGIITVCAVLKIQKKWFSSRTGMVISGVIAAIGASLGSVVMFYRPDDWSLGGLCWLVPMAAAAIALMLFGIIIHKISPYRKAGLLEMILFIVLALVLPAGITAFWCFRSVPNKKIATISHHWKWHHHETFYLKKWRNEPEYAALKNNLSKAIEEAESMNKLEEAFKAIDQADPIRKCFAKRAPIIPPWRNEIQNQLDNRLEKMLDEKVKLEEENQHFLRLVFCRQHFPKSEKIIPDKVMDHFFRRYLKEAVEKYEKDRYFNSIRDHLDSYADTDDLRQTAAKKVLKKILEKLYDEIKENKFVEGRPEPPKILKYHTFFSSLRRLSPENADLKEIFDEYDKSTKARNDSQRKHVNAAAKKAEKSSDLKQWQSCDFSLIDQFRHDLPLVNYILWEYGHNPSDNNGVASHRQEYLYSLKNKSEKDMEACFYYAEILNEQHKTGEARNYYHKIAKLYDANQNQDREKYIKALHLTAKSFEDKTDIRREAWIRLDQENQLEQDEKLQFARDSFLQKEYERMVRLYNTSELINLTLEDCWHWLEHSKDIGQKKKVIFPRLCELVPIEAAQLSHLSELWDQLDTREAVNKIQDKLKTAVEKNLSEIYPFAAKIALKKNAENWDRSTQMKLMKSSLVPYSDRIRLADLSGDDKEFINLCAEALEKGNPVPQKILKNAWNRIFSLGGLQSMKLALLFWDNLPEQEKGNSEYRNYLIAVTETKDFSRNRIEDIFRKLEKNDSGLEPNIQSVLKLKDHFHSRKDFAAEAYFLELCLRKFEKLHPESKYREYCGQISYLLYELFLFGGKAPENLEPYAFRRNADAFYSGFISKGEDYLKKAFRYQHKDLLMELGRCWGSQYRENKELYDFAGKHKDELKQSLEALKLKPSCTESDKKQISDWLSDWP